MSSSVQTHNNVNKNPSLSSCTLLFKAFSVYWFKITILKGKYIVLWGCHVLKKNQPIICLYFASSHFLSTWAFKIVCGPFEIFLLSSSIVSPTIPIHGHGFHSLQISVTLNNWLYCLHFQMYLFTSFFFCSYIISFSILHIP